MFLTLELSDFGVMMLFSNDDWFSVRFTDASKCAVEPASCYLKVAGSIPPRFCTWKRPRSWAPNAAPDVLVGHLARQPPPSASERVNYCNSLWFNAVNVCACVCVQMASVQVDYPGVVTQTYWRWHLKDVRGQTHSLQEALLHSPSVFSSSSPASLSCVDV